MDIDELLRLVTEYERLKLKCEVEKSRASTKADPDATPQSAVDEFLPKTPGERVLWEMITDPKNQELLAEVSLIALRRPVPRTPMWRMLYNECKKRSSAQCEKVDDRG